MRRNVFEFRKRLMASVGLAPLAVAGGLFATALPAQFARAEEAQVEEVKVTARQREEKAQDVPLPVSVVGAKTQERERLERLQDFAQKVPNFVPTITNPRTSAMSIRGISGISGGADGSESAVGLIVDNVFYTHVGFQWADFVDLQSFEVARGPQGTLLGKNTTVGAVVIRTQLPSFARSAMSETTFGNYNRVIQKLNVTGPIIDDKLAYRVTLLYDRGDGWINNQFNSQKLLDNNRWGVRGQLLYVGDNFTDRLIFDRLRSDEYNNYGGVIGNSFPLWANGAPARLYSQNLASRLGRPVLTFDPYRPYLTRLGKLDQRTTGLSNEINYTIGENTLTAVSAWREFILHPRNSTGNQLTDVSANAFDVFVDQYSHETRLASPAGQTLEWTIGNYNLYSTIWSYNHVDYGAQASQWFSNNINANPLNLWGLEARNDGKARTFSTALFGQATWHIDDQWSLTAGLRDTFEIRGGSNFGWVKGLYGNPFAQIAAVRQATGGTTFFDTGGQEKGNNSLSGLLNPSYRYNENVMVYGSVARGEKSGAVNTQALPLFDGNRFVGFQPVVIKPETSWDYEIGAKTNWLDNKLIVNVNAYWNDIYNFQAIQQNTEFLGVDGVPLRRNFLGNVGQVRLRGFEFDGRWSPIDRLWLTFSGAYTDARYVSFPNSAPPQEWTWPAAANINGVAAPSVISLSGKRITGGVSGNNPVAPVSFNVGFSHEYPLGSFLSVAGYAGPVTLFSYANAAWRAKTTLSSPVSVYPLYQAPYALVNAGLGLKTDDDAYSFNLWVRNLLDERVFIAQNIGSPTAASTVTFAADNPRTFGATLRMKIY